MNGPRRSALGTIMRQRIEPVDARAVHVATRKALADTSIAEGVVLLALDSSDRALKVLGVVLRRPEFSLHHKREATKAKEELESLRFRSFRLALAAGETHAAAHQGQAQRSKLALLFARSSAITSSMSALVCRVLEAEGANEHKPHKGSGVSAA